MQWLVTGGAGFIGSNFVHLLAKENPAHKIIVLDALTYAGNMMNISQLVEQGKIHFMHGNICDTDLVRKIFTKFDINRVIHFAAESHVDRSILDAKAFIRTNVEGTFSLLEAARSYWSGKSDVRFLHVSTDEVFGSLNPEDAAFHEETPYDPNSPYSASKAAADHLVRAWFNTYEVPTIITNCSNNYGPYQFPEKLIPLMILNTLDEKPLPIYGDGLQVRDWIHVADHCRALMMIMKEGKPGETYLVGGNNEMKNVDVVHCICDNIDHLRGNAPGTSRQLIRHITDRPGHDKRYAVNTGKIEQQFNWKPCFCFAEHIPQLIKWYIENRTWTEQIKSGEYREYYAKQYVDLQR